MIKKGRKSIAFSLVCIMVAGLMCVNTQKVAAHPLFYNGSTEIDFVRHDVLSASVMRSVLETPSYYLPQYHDITDIANKY